jgi:hypothetical protein
MNHCLFDEKGVDENGNGRNPGEPVRFRRGVSRKNRSISSGVSKDFCVNERFDEVVRPDALTRVSALLLSEIGTVS